METRLGEIDGEMASCARNFVKLNELTEEKTQLETQLEEKIDAVITTGPPMSTHLVGQKLKKRFHLHWIADFRDPWTDIYYYNKMYPTPIAKAIDRKYERNVLLDADQVITVSDYIKKQLAAKSPAIQASKIKVIANGFDAEDFDLIIPKEDVFTITYTGTLAADYTIDSFIHTVKRLSTSEKLKLRFVGKVDQGIAQKLSEQLGDSVEIHTFVAHADAIKYMKSSSVLLLIIPNIEGNKGNLTGKLFEYIGSRTPILCLGPTDGDAATIIQVCKAGKTFEYDDEEGEVDRLLDDVDFGERFEGYRDRLIIEMFYTTGMRLSELIGLDDKDVDFSASLIKVTGKRNKQRLIPFDKELGRSMQEYVNVRNQALPVRSDAFFVRKNGERLGRGIVAYIVRRNLSKVVTVKKRSPHVLRHTFATAMLNNGADLSSIKELLGHESLATTEVYTHTTFEELKKVYNQAHPRA